MKVKISFAGDCFLTAHSILDFVLSVIHFSPVTMLGPEGEYAAFDRSGALSEIKFAKSLQIADDYYQYHDERNYVFFRQADPFTFTQVVTLYGEKLNNNVVEKTIEAAHQQGFFLAYYYNELNTLDQNEKIPGNLEFQGKPHAHLKKIWDPILSPALNAEIIDIRQNPGHEKATYGTWLYAGPEMWFGKLSWQYFDQDRIKAFSQAEKIAALEQDLLYVKLFDPQAPNYETEEILAIQKAFRAQSGMDKIEEELDAISFQKAIENGNLVKSVTNTIYTDNKGNTTVEAFPEEKEFVLSPPHNIYQQLKAKYTSYHFDPLVSLANQEYSIMTFQKTVPEGLMKFSIELPGNPVKIYKADIKLYTHSQSDPTRIKEYPEYDEILKDAGKLAKGKSIS